MSMKLERIENEMQRVREKIAEQQARLKGLDAQRTEAENLLIVGIVRAMCVTREELSAFIRGEFSAENAISRKNNRAKKSEIIVEKSEELNHEKQ
jgi:hypothetical protein